MGDRVVAGMTALLASLLGAALVSVGCVTVIVQPHHAQERIETDVEMVRRALLEVRRIGTAFESLAVDRNRYPMGDAPVLSVGGFALSAVRVLFEEDENHVYMRGVPSNDPWGNPYLFWSDGQHYVVATLGADGLLGDEARFLKLLESEALGASHEQLRSHCMEEEIVYATGMLLWWPRDSLRRCNQSDRTRQAP